MIFYQNTLLYKSSLVRKRKEFKVSKKVKITSAGLSTFGFDQTRTNQKILLVFIIYGFLAIGFITKTNPYILLTSIILLIISTSLF